MSAVGLTPIPTRFCISFICLDAVSYAVSNSLGPREWFCTWPEANHCFIYLLSSHFVCIKSTRSVLPSPVSVDPSIHCASSMLRSRSTFCVIAASLSASSSAPSRLRSLVIHPGSRAHHIASRSAASSRTLPAAPSALAALNSKLVFVCYLELELDDSNEDDDDGPPNIELTFQSRSDKTKLKCASFAIVIICRFGFISRLLHVI